MAKYSPAFKREVVEAYLRRTELGPSGMGVKRLAAHYGIARTQIRYWVAMYEMHGQAGLDQRPYQSHTADFKLEVLQQMWKQDLSLTQTTVLFNIRDPSLVAKWERLYAEGGIQALKPKPRGGRRVMPKPSEPPTVSVIPDSGETREDLLKENSLLRAEVAYLKKLDALIQEKKLARQKRRRD